MADTPEWEPRVRVLEEIAASTKEVLTEIKGEMAGIRTEMREMRRDMTQGFERVQHNLPTLFDTANQRRERDFRILFGAIIVVAIGLAGLIAHTQHWI